MLILIVLAILFATKTKLHFKGNYITLERNVKYITEPPQLQYIVRS